MNDSDPTSAVTLLFKSDMKVKVYGLCHSLQKTLEEVTVNIGLPVAELGDRCAGVGHLSWFADVTCKGHDVLPGQRSVAEKTKFDEQNIISIETFKQFSTFPNGSSGHFCGSAASFGKHRDLVVKALGR